jgi:outer membrane protein assembly factor BamA
MDKTDFEGIRSPVIIKSKTKVFRRVTWNVCLLMFFLAGSASAQSAADTAAVVRRVRIHGNRRFSKSELAEAMGLRTNAPLPKGWPGRPMDQLLERYRADGFFLARLDSVRVSQPDSGRMELDVWIREGVRTGIGRLDLTGVDEPDGEALRSRLDLGPGSAFRESALRSDVDRILSFYEDRGRPLAVVSIGSLRPEAGGDGSKIDLRLDVQKGPPVTIQSVKPEGNTLTRPNVIVRETRLKAGSPYRQKDVAAARENLRALGFFKEVSEPKTLFFGDKAVVVFPVQEGGTNTFDGVIGYNPPKTDEDRGTFTGRLEFSFQNLFGTGRRLDAFWEKKDQRTQNIRFGYEEPWLFNRPVFPGLKFSQEIRDTTYVEREWQVSVRFKPWPVFSAGLDAGQKQILPDSIGSAILRIAQSSTWFASGVLDYTTLDDPLNPRRGVRYHTSVTFGRKRNLGPEFILAEDSLVRNANTKQILMDVEALAPTLSRQAVYCALHWRDVKSGEATVPLADQVRFGGATTVRGYEEDAFRGSTVAWANLEYRYLFGRRSRAFAFVDGGIYQRREQSGVSVKGAKIGYGIGIRLETKLGVVGVDYGLGEGDGLSRGKVHVGLKNAF